MGSILKIAVFLSIWWLIPSVITHSDQDKDKRLNNKHSNQNDPGIRDFYFDEPKKSDDNVKTGRTIPHTAWSKEDKEQSQPVENKADAQFNDAFSFKNVVSYLLNMIQELKKDIFSIKEMSFLKNDKDLTNSEDNDKQNKMGENTGRLKSDASTKNTEFEKENQKPKSNYIIDYYQNNYIKFAEDELDISSDESDDSSHKPNEETSLHEISKQDDACISECSKFKKPERYFSEAEETTAIPTNQIKIESDKEFDDTKEPIKDYLKESTTKPSKTSREETKNTLNAITGKCVKKNYDNSNNLNRKNEPSEKSFKYAEILTTSSPQDENFNKAKHEESDQNKTSDDLLKMPSSSPDYIISRKDLQNTGGSDFDGKSDVLGQSTTMFSQSSGDPDIVEQKPNAPEMYLEKPAYKNEQEQMNSLKPKEQGASKSHQNVKKANEDTAVPSQFQEAGGETPDHELNTVPEMKDNPKESENEALKITPHTSVTNSENGPNSKKGEQKTSNSFNTDNSISPTSTLENILNENNLNKDLSEDNGKKGTNENEKSNDTQESKNYSEPQRDSETEQVKTQLSRNSKPEKSLENNKLNNSNNGNNNKDDNLTMPTNDIAAPKDSNSGIQSRDVEGSGKPQEVKKNKEFQNENDEMYEISPDEEYEYEDDNEDFDISDELTDIETDEDFEQNQEDELLNDDDENNDEMNPSNTTTVMTKEWQIYQNAEYMTEEKPQEQYNTFLEYFYKNSNNSIFQSLKNQ